MKAAIAGVDRASAFAGRRRTRPRTPSTRNKIAGGNPAKPG